MELIIMALATAFNIMIIKWKFEHQRATDAVFDATLLGILALVFGGSLGGMMIATASSALISLYLLWSPLRIKWD